MTKPIPLPKYLIKAREKRNVTSGYSPLDNALVFALSIRLHGTSQALRKAARAMIDVLPFEQKSKMNEISRLDDEILMIAGLSVVNRVCFMLDIEPSKPFTIEPNQSPRCHMKPMLLLSDGWFHCQHCKHTKPVSWRPSK